VFDAGTEAWVANSLLHKEAAKTSKPRARIKVPGTCGYACERGMKLAGQESWGCRFRRDLRVIFATCGED
jgi:hypothetical protein